MNQEQEIRDIRLEMNRAVDEYLAETASEEQRLKMQAVRNTCEKLLAGNPDLTEIEFANCATDENVTLLTDNLHLCPITKVNLSFSCTSEEVLVRFMDSLHGQTVVELSLAWTHITLGVCQALCNYLTTKPCTLNFLSLGEACLNEEMVTMIVKALKINTSIKTINMCGVAIGPDTKKLLLDTISNNPSVNFIRFDCTLLGDETFDEIFSKRIRVLTSDAGLAERENRWVRGQVGRFTKPARRR